MAAIPGTSTSTPGGRLPDMPYSEPTTPSGAAQTVGFIGLGNIGANIARNLAVHTATQRPAAFNFLFWNRTKEKAVAVQQAVEQTLEASGGMVSVKVVDSVEEVVKGSDIILSSMANDDAALHLARQIAAACLEESASKLRIVVETSTLYPTTAGQIDTILTANSNTRFICGPVFGAPQAAKEAKLIICLAGDYSSKKKIAYLLVPAAGRKCIDLGGNVEKAASFKLLGNSFIAGTLELLAETQTLADKVGVGANTLHDLITELFPAPPIHGYGKRMLTDNFDASNGFNINGGLKDVHHMQRLAAEHEVPMPVIDIVQQHLVTAKALNAGLPDYKRIQNMDWSSLVAANRVAAGMDPFDSSIHKRGPVLDDQ